MGGANKVSGGRHLAAVTTTILLCSLLAETPAAGQPVPYPIGVTILPVESGLLRSHFDLQVVFTRFSRVFGDFAPSENFLAMAIQPQIAIADRVEVGLTFPYLVVSPAQPLGRSAKDIGNLDVTVKVKLLGGVKKRLGLALFANTTLPTSTALQSRDLLGLHSGVAFTKLIGTSLGVGGSMGSYWVAQPGDDVLYYQLDGWIGYFLIGEIAIQLLFQLAAPLLPERAEPAVSMTPAFQFYVHPRVHIDLGARLGLNDTGRLYSAYGRVALVTAMGVLF